MIDDLESFKLASKVKSSFSISLANNSYTKVLSSLIFCESIKINSGASLTGDTFKLVCLVVVYTPSVTVTIKILFPYSFSFGLRVNVLVVPLEPVWTSNEIESEGNSVGLVFTNPTVNWSFES